MNSENIKPKQPKSEWEKQGEIRQQNEDEYDEQRAMVARQKHNQRIYEQNKQKPQTPDTEPTLFD